MGVLVAAVLFLGITSLIFWFGYRHYVRPSKLLDQLTISATEQVPVHLMDQKQEQTFGVPVLLEHLGDLMPVSPQDAAIAKKELIAAGFRGPSAVPVYYGSKVCLCLAMLLVACALRHHVSNPVLRMVLPIASGAAGWSSVSFLLAKRTRARQESIRLALPDVLDLMVICSEAGCGLDQAILNVSRDLRTVHPILAEELSMVNMEIMAGKSRADALRNLGRRCGEEDVKKLVAILIQTDRFGTSVSEALRTQSEFMRIRRRQEAEERAGKVGVKLVFPIFFFCLPSLMVVTAGPGMLQLFKNLFPAMQSVGH